MCGLNNPSYGYAINFNSSCGGIFRDFKGTYFGGFASNLGHGNVYEVELSGLMFAMEYAASHNLFTRKEIVVQSLRLLWGKTRLPLLGFIIC